MKSKREYRKEEQIERRMANGEATSSIRGPRDGWAEVLNDFGIKTLMAFVSFPRLWELFRNF